MHRSNLMRHLGLKGDAPIVGHPALTATAIAFNACPATR
jgi:hypothetical protein